MCVLYIYISSQPGRQEEENVALCGAYVWRTLNCEKRFTESSSQVLQRPTEKSFLWLTLTNRYSLGTRRILAEGSSGVQRPRTQTTNLRPADMRRPKKAPIADEASFQPVPSHTGVPVPAAPQPSDQELASQTRIRNQPSQFIIHTSRNNARDLH